MNLSISRIAVLAFVLIFMPIAHAEVKILEDFQEKTLHEGQVNSYLSIRDEQYQQVFVYYRVSDTHLFVPFKLTKKKDKWLWHLKSSQVAVPGIDYYFEAQLKNGIKETLPKTFPRYNPLTMPVKAKDDIQISVNSISNEAIDIRVDGQLSDDTRIYIGDIDASDFVERSRIGMVSESVQIDLSVFDLDEMSELTIQSEQGLVLASHNLSELVNRAADKSTGDHYIKITGSGSLNVGGQDSWEEDKQERSVNGNFGLGTEYRHGEFIATVEGLNVNYQHGADEEIKLGTGYLVSMKYRDTGVEIGDVSTTGTSLVMSGFSRRGMKAMSEGQTWKAEIFNVRTVPVEGWESGIAFDDRQTYGGSFEKELGEDNATRLNVSLVSGELSNDDAAENVGSSSQTEQAGDSFGVQVSTELSGFGIDAQVASSKFDQDTNDAIEAEQDQAYELNLSKDIYGLASSVGYQRYGANYATIANPNFSGDREGYDLSLGSAWHDLSWNASFSTTRDNVEEDSSRAIVTSNNYGISTSLNRKLWPSLNLGYNISRQSSRDEPSADDEIDNTGYDINAGLSDSIGLLNWGWNSSYGLIKDKLDAINTSHTSNHGFNLSRTFSSGDVSLNLSRNKQWSAIVTRSDLLNLSANIPLLSEKFILNAQFSGQTNRSSDDSVDNVIVGGSARLAWSLQDMVMIKGLQWADPQFSLTWTTNRQKDRNDLGNITDDNSLVLEFSLGAPYQFEQTWFFDENEFGDEGNAEARDAL